MSNGQGASDGIRGEGKEQTTLQKDYFSIKFQNNDLIDLINDQVLPENHQRDRSINAFMRHRVVDIEKPQLIKEGYLTSYKLYRVKTKKKNSQDWETSVPRRFNDFQYLHFNLLENYGGFVLPQLPHKNFLATLNLETREFQEERVSELRKYLNKLMNHPQVRLSRQLECFLFQKEYNFSSEKGQFYEQGGSLSGIKNLTENMVVMGKSFLGRYLKERRTEPGKKSEEEELKVFCSEIEDLVQVTLEIKQMIAHSYQELEIVKEFSRQNPGQRAPLSMEAMIEEFNQISEFIEDCMEAIVRTRRLKDQVDELELEQEAIAVKQNERPRNKQLDTIRSKLFKCRIKYEKWVSSLKQQLTTYTSEGRTLMENFVRKFIEQKKRVYLQLPFRQL